MISDEFPPARGTLSTVGLAELALNFFRFLIRSTEHFPSQVGSSSRTNLDVKRPFVSDPDRKNPCGIPFRRYPNWFPLSPEPCSSAFRRNTNRFGTQITLVNRITYGGIFLRSDGEGDHRACPPASTLTKCNLRAKSGAVRDRYGRPAAYSNLRISTGKSRAAARAGTSVAPTEISIAANEIQSPSRMFA